MDLMDFDDSMKESLVASVHFQRRKFTYRLVSMCLGLLCAVLLVGNIGQIIYHKKHSNQVTADSMSAEARLSNLTRDKDQLQRNYNTLRQDRDQLQTNMQRNLSNAQREKSELQTQFNSMRTNRDELQTQFNSMRTNRDELQTQFNSMRTNRDELQTQFNSMRTNRDELQTQFNSMKTNRDELQTQFNSMRTNRDELQRNYSSVKSEKDQLQMEKDQFQSNYSRLSTARDQLEKKVTALEAMLRETGWKNFNKSWYHLSDEKMNWADSRSDCQAKGADLVIINSKEEHNFVAGLVPTGENTWIGLSDNINEGMWKWVDGTPVTTTYWEAGQPNSHGGNQDCGEMVQRGEWNDETCGTLNRWICELYLE